MRAVPVTLLGAAATAAMLCLLVPAPVAAHGLTSLYESPLPLPVYLAGAAAAVAISFAIAFAAGGRWQPSPRQRTRHLPRTLVLALRALGLLAWAWIMAQLVVGGSSDGEVDTLFTWVYGWVGVAMVCAIVGPLWSWLDPFSALFDLGARLTRRLGLGGWRAEPYPATLAAWPAVLGFAFFVWLELAYRRADIGLVVAIYTVYTLVGMTAFGKDVWRERAEVFSVWFGLLGRLARYAPAGSPESGAVRRQHLPDGLLGNRWDPSLVTLAAIASGAILFDGLSQTEAFLSVFGLPDIGGSSLLLVGFLAVLAALAHVVARRVGHTAMGAGLLPISVGYLIAHYLTYLLGDGQRILIAVSDPLQLGWDLFGTAFHEPSIEWLPAELLWGLIFTSVVGGHVIGAWAGHRAAASGAPEGGTAGSVQLPLAAMMVALTTLTLWSLGQAVITEAA